MLHIHTADFRSSRDAAEVVALLDAYARDPMGGGTPLSEHTRTHLAAELAKRPHAHALIARMDDEPAGLAICIEAFSSFACAPILNVHDFMVDGAFRKQGVGAQLMAGVETLARELGCCKVTLEVLEGNGPARKLYENAGFAPYVLDSAVGHAQFWQKYLTA